MAQTSVAQIPVAKTIPQGPPVVVEDTPNSSSIQIQPPQTVYIVYDTDEEAQENSDNAFCAICKKTFKNAKGLNTHNRVHKKK